jgi:hypothetical protein
MPSQGPNSGSSFTTSGTPAWNNPTNAQSSNDQYATVTVPAGQSSGSLLATGFGFSIPSGATVTGVVVGLEGAADAGSLNWVVYLLVGGSRTGNSRSASIPRVEGYVDLGSPTDLWGTTLTPSNVNGTGFGAEIIVSSSAAYTLGVSLDHVRITVYYELGEGFFYQSMVL